MTRHTRESLTAAALELTDRDHLWQRLHDLLEADMAAMMREDKSKPRKQPTAPTPWNDTAAHLISDIAAGARRHENGLTLVLFNRARYRGGDDRHTRGALHALPDLITTTLDQHPALPDTAPDEQPWQHQRAVHAAHDLALWPTRARALLDETRDHERPWQPSPGGLVCPCCERRLHLAPGWEDAIHSARLVCRACPAALDGTPLPPADRIDRSWAASEWMPTLRGDGGHAA